MSGFESRTGVRIVAEQQPPEREAERTGVVPKPVGPLGVERITTHDVPAVCALYKKVWETEPTGGLPAELVKTWQPGPLEFTSRMEGVTYFAARRNGHVVGIVGCEIKDGSCHLVHLAVDPDARRQGVASALLATAVDWARRANVTEVWVDALARFPAAAELFQRLGFQECGVLHKHLWNQDVRLFERLL
jgi:[ribosomal protein S18]-alanine N-acetyltransferase